MLIETGLIFIILGSLFRGTNLESRVAARLRGNPLVEKISGNLGVLFFVIGIILLLAGVVDLYYG